VAPQRPRPPQPGRSASPRRPAAPRPAPARDSGDGGRGTGRPTAATGRPKAPERTAPDGAQEPFPGSEDATAPVPTTRPRTAATPAAGRPVTPRRTSGTVGAPRPATPRTPAAPRTPAGGVVSQGSAARFAERARAHRRLTQRRVLIALGALLAVGAVVWLLFFSPVLALHAAQVRITGADSVVAVDQVQAVVDARDGAPLPRLDTSALRSELLEVPGVRDATVTREWPHGLSVALVAREPVAAVPEDSDVVQSAEGTPTGAGFALVDEEGVQVGRADEAPEGLPVVDVPVGEERVLTAVLGVLEQLPADLLAQVGQVSATTQDSVNFTLRDGAAVEWGSDQDSALKAAVLSALRAAPETAGASRYDVSAPTMPVVG
jgi:cell division protein FtsQ